MTQPITQEQWDKAGFGAVHPPVSLDQANDRITFCNVVKKLGEATDEIASVRKMLVESNSEIHALTTAKMSLESRNKALSDELTLLRQNNAWLNGQQNPLLPPFQVTSQSGPTL